MYRIVVEHRAAKEIESLPNDITPHIVNTIAGLKSNPRPYGVKKLAGEIGWRIRIRDYRILYTIDDKQKVVAVYRVKHRREVYR